MKDKKGGGQQDDNSEEEEAEALLGGPPNKDQRTLIDAAGQQGYDTPLSDQFVCATSSEDELSSGVDRSNKNNRLKLEE